MTVKGWFKLYRFGFLSFTVLVSACATANAPDPKKVAEQAIAPLDMKAELSSHEVVSGTLAIVSMRLPPEYRTQPATAEFEGIELPIFPDPAFGEDYYEAVLTVPYERKPGPGVVSIHFKNDAISKTLILPFEVVEGNYPSEILHVGKRRVNPTAKEDVDRIVKEQAEIAIIYKRVTPKKYWSGAFDLPISSKVTSPFGSRRLYNGKLKNFHPGMDLRAPLKTPIYSPAPGVVVMAKNLFYTGNTVVLDHGYGVITLYCHMSELGVQVGQEVGKHALLGLSGKTGRVNGPHLHWQAVIHRTKVNPMGLVQVMK